MSTKDDVITLKLTLHNRLVGYLIGFQNGRNVLSFAEKFKNDNNRPTFSLITHPNFPEHKRVMSKPLIKYHRLHPILSNLLPEGVLRQLVAQKLKVHIDNEFHILSYLGKDLPGAIIAEAIEPDEVPESILSHFGKAKSIKLENKNQANKFSLAGVQMKFSMKEIDGRYNLSTSRELGDWIIKTPSTKHKHVPLNEFTAMKLAALVGVNIPEIKLVKLNDLGRLPQINLPNEEFAYAIKRFDRQDNVRIHMEDFAQVLVKYPNDKYGKANYQQIGRVLYTYSGDEIADVQQLARRLLVNIMLANGDAHLKNWSLLYQDQVTPRLSPAYDIVTTSVYIDDEQEFALNLGKSKDWFKADFSYFEKWASKSHIPWRIIRPHLEDTMEKARSLWPAALKDLPMHEEHKTKLKKHWKSLQADFRIE